MRGKEDNLKKLKEALKKTYTNGISDFEQLQTLLKPDKNGYCEYFLGIRENYYNLYYKSMSMAKIILDKNGICKYEISYWYVKNSKFEINKDKGYVSLNSADFWNPELFENIKEQINQHVLGGHDDKMRLEKVCQQWIINANNSNPKSDWFYVDMEYIYQKDGVKEDNPFGRADLIAVSKKKNSEDIHEVAFIELKVGYKAYEGKPDLTEGHELYMKYLAEDLYDEKINDIKLGSGLASHVVDFMHFFAIHAYADQTRNEIINMLREYIEFGIINPNEELANISNVSLLSIKPDIYFVTYSQAPNITINDVIGKRAIKNYPKTKLRGLKSSFFNHLYDCGFAVVKIMNEKDIQGIIECKDRFRKFINDNNCQITCEQNINGENYNFIFRFIDLSQLVCEDWECLPPINE